MVFLKRSWGIPDKGFSEWNEDDQRQDLHPHQPTKVSSYAPLQANQPLGTSIRTRSTARLAQMGIHGVIRVQIDGIRG